MILGDIDQPLPPSTTDAALDIRTTRIRGREQKVEHYPNAETAQARLAELQAREDAAQRRPFARELRRGARKGQWKVTFWKFGGFTR